MPDATVATGSTARLGKIEGDLKVGSNAKILAESGNRVVVTGGAYFDGPVNIACDFECGQMRVAGKGFGPGPAHGDVKVTGSLLVQGELEIDASAEVNGNITAERVDIGGHLKSKSITSKRVRIGGHMETDGTLEAEDVDVGGHMQVDGQVNIANLRVGGHTDIGGGNIREAIQVRGHFRTRGKLSYGDFHVFGHLTLPAGSRGRRLRALGKVELEGDGYCKTMEVNGVARASGNLEAESLKVNGKLEVEGVLKVEDKLEVFGSMETTNEVECGALAVGGRLVAAEVASSGRADLGGEVETDRGLKAKEIAVGTGSRVKGPLIGDVVEVGKGLDLGGFWAQVSNWRSIGRTTKVDDVYGMDVRIDRYSQAKNVYAETVRMQSGSMAVEVLYTREADVSDGVHLERPLRKVEMLPGFPF